VEMVEERDQDELDSEEEDDDYNPEAEAASSGDELEDDVASDPDCPSGPKGRKKKGAAKRKKPAAKPKQVRARAGGIALSDSEEEAEFQKKLKAAANPVEEPPKEEEERQEEKASSSKTDSLWAEMNAEEPKKDLKKKTDDLWAELNAGVSIKPAPKPSQVPTFGAASVSAKAPAAAIGGLSFPTSVRPSTVSTSVRPSTVTGRAYTVTEKLDFAGEEVVITKKVEVGSQEDEKRLKMQQNQLKRGTGTNLDALVASVTGKKKTCTTLDKSTSDWAQFKQKEGIEDELEHYKKDGYLEKVAFLDRTDTRQAEAYRSLKRTRRG